MSFQVQKPKHWNCKSQQLQIFLQLYYSTILHVELYCSTIAKENINILSLSLSSLISVSLISHLCLSIAEASPNRIPQHSQPSTTDQTPNHYCSQIPNNHHYPATQAKKPSTTTMT